MNSKSIFCVGVLLLSLTVSISADTNANCTYEDIKGTWIFELQNENHDRTVDCSQQFETGHVLKFELSYPNIAVDEFNNEGTWTLIYNQGFEIVIAGRKYFGFSSFKGDVSFCHLIKGGWSHDTLGRDWACFNGRKTESATKYLQSTLSWTSEKSQLKPNSKEFVSMLNKYQNSWTATTYPQFDGLTSDDLIKLTGGKKSQIHSWPKPIPLTEEHKKIGESLPGSFDWRNVNGVNFVSPVRNQGHCGSCYAFASMAMAEARLRIQTNNTQTLVFSPQDIVECSHYSQGCEGGFPYLVAGKYAEDYGLVTESCNVYKGVDGSCHTDKSCPRHYFTDYSYIGGFYGGCNEVLMQQAIYERGPIAISFMVHPDFQAYKSGVYHHVADIPGSFKFNPFVETNHVMLVVGWGQLSPEKGGTKYWIVKNSWGTSWGLQGYSHIRRGTDECGIESIAAESSPVYKYL